MANLLLSLALICSESLTLNRYAATELEMEPEILICIRVLGQIQKVFKPFDGNVRHCSVVLLVSHCSPMPHQ